MVVHRPLRIIPRALYSETSLFTAGIPRATVKQARESGRLRFTRQGNRVLFLGRWVLDWLESEAENIEREGGAR